MVLNESDLSHRAAQDTLPLRDAFAVLFFVSVGMLFDPMVLIEHPLGILATLAIIIIGKSLAALVLVRMFGHSRRTALTISASLAQIGEFAFILAGMGVALNVLEPDARNLVLAGALVSIMLNPVLFSLLDRYLAKTETKEEQEQLQQEEMEEEMPVPVDICGHAIIVGYGRAGSMLTEKLQPQAIPLVIIENSRNKFAELKEKGLNAVLGNAMTKESLALARVDCAKSLLLTIPNGYEAADIAETARKMNPDLNIIVRAHFDDIIVRANYDEEASFILEKGANHVIIDEDQTASAMAKMLIKEVEFGCAIDDTPEDGQQIIAPNAAQ